MSSEVVNNIIESLDHYVSEDGLGVPFFSNPNIRPLSIDGSSFKSIKSLKSDRKFAFIDGGNQEVLGAPNFSVQINRVCYSVFSGKERIKQKKITKRVEFFSMTYSIFKNKEIFYETKLFPIRDSFSSMLPSEPDLSFSSWDRTITSGIQRADIGKVASIPRKFAEWNFAVHVAEEELDRGDMLVMDGSLQSLFTNEKVYSNGLFEVASSKEVIVSGLSKTSRLYTDTGLSLIGAVQKLASDSLPVQSIWYLPVAEAAGEDYDAMIFMVKLNEVSKYIFRYEINRGQFLKLDQQEIDEIMSQLACNSSDISFPGYPYGLIDADMFARIRNDEIDYYRSTLLSEISRLGKWKKFEKHLHAVDAHGLLNTLMV